jgi:hypothetical protein
MTPAETVSHNQGAIILLGIIVAASYFLYSRYKTRRLGSHSFQNTSHTASPTARRNLSLFPPNTTNPFSSSTDYGPTSTTSRALSPGIAESGAGLRSRSPHLAVGETVYGKAFAVEEGSAESLIPSSGARDGNGGVVEEEDEEEEEGESDRDDTVPRVQLRDEQGGEPTHIHAPTARKPDAPSGTRFVESFD